MISSKKNDEILKAIDYIKSKNINSRKLTIEDIIKIQNDKSNYVKNDKVKSFRMQEEFGPKKRIKP